MAKLTTKQRKNLSDSDYAIVKKGKDGRKVRKYPINNKSHARNALARVAQDGTAAEKRQVRSAVHKKYPDIK